MAGKNKKRTVLLAILSAVPLLALAVNIVLFVPLGSVLDSYFVNTSGDKETTASAKENAVNVAKEIQSEGCVLLKNDNNALPLSETTKINLLGYKSTDMVYGGSGSGSVDSSKGIKLTDALANVGFTVNPDLISLYGSGTGGSANGGVGAADFNINELPQTSYTGKTSPSSLKDYSDTAVIVFGRNGGEGSDLPMTGYGTDGKNSYLALSAEEDALVKMATETFDKTVVLLNAANPMELDFVKKYDVDACLWIGDPGSYGNESIAKILKGEINPSGKTVDTYAYKGADAPAAQNFGKFEYDNADGYHVNYAEGIYVGYKWYETAYAEGYYNDTTYSETVAYPFGYGLSYTTFSQEIVGGTENNAVVKASDDIHVNVEVANDGTDAGKEVVEIYYSAPYTNGGIEKSAVNLIATQKTNSLQGNEKQTLELSFKAEDMASYDKTANDGKGAYVLEKGDYVISLRSDAHTVLSSFTVKVEDTVTFDGENKRSSDKVAAENLFSSAEGDFTYLSRKDGFANYSIAMAAPSSTADEETVSQLSGGYKNYTADYTGEKPTLGAQNNVVLEDLRGLDYNDNKWDSLLDELKIGELKDLIGYGGYGTSAITSIDKKATIDTDGPCGISYYMNASSFDCVSYPCETVLGSTWNKEIANDYGEAVGEEANAWGITGWYAPGMNIHRTSFCGRTYEYFSEDGYLSALLSTEETKGAVSKGVIVYAKHFALNEQETVRDKKLCVWASEQSMREIYFKPFEDSVKKGNANGIMTSYSLIGNRWTGASSNLNNSLLREEWGFIGVVVSDYNGYDYMDPDAGIHGGNDLMLSTLGKRPSQSTADSIYYMRKAAHNILYTIVNSNAYDSSISTTSGISWRTVAIIIDCVLGVLVIAGYGFIIFKTREKN